MAQEHRLNAQGEPNSMKTDLDSEKEKDGLNRRCVSFTIPYRLKSESNLREHWLAKAKRHTRERDMIKLYLRDHEPNLPCLVQLIRIAPRRFDDDNLVSAFKHIRDCISEHLIPNLAKGRADADPRIKWAYGQQNGKPKEYEIRIEIYA